MRESLLKAPGWSAMALLLALAAASAPALAGEAASVSFGTTGVLFQPTVAGEGFTLRVSCSDGTYFERQYLGSEVISLHR